jgi:rare lipoprotein A
MNVKTGESVIVMITDRGPNVRLHRLIDLSKAAAGVLGYVEQGVTPVFLSLVMPFETSAAIF